MLVLQYTQWLSREHLFLSGHRYARVANSTVCMSGASHTWAQLIMQHLSWNHAIAYHFHRSQRYAKILQPCDLPSCGYCGIILHSGTEPESEATDAAKPRLPLEAPVELEFELRRLRQISALAKPLTSFPTAK